MNEMSRPPRAPNGEERDPRPRAIQPRTVEILPAVPEPDRKALVKQVERLALENLGADLGRIRNWIIEFDARNKQAETWTQAVEIARYYWLRDLVTQLEAEYQLAAAEQAHTIRMQEIDHAAAEFEKRIRLKVGQALKTFREQAETIVSLQELVDEVKKRNPAAGTRLERILSNTVTTISGYSAPIQ